MATRNTLALLGLRSFLKDNPDKHDPHQWAVAPDAEFDVAHTDVAFTCGTKACVAGWTSLLSGDLLTRDSGTVDHQRNDGVWLYRVGRVTTPDGRSVPIAQRARDVLGLNTTVASALFHTGNTNVVVLKALKRLANGVPDDEVIDFLAKHNPRVLTHPQYWPADWN